MRQLTTDYQAPEGVNGEFTFMTTKVATLLRSAGVEDPGRMEAAESRPDPEVPARARRRTFTAQYKLDIVAEYDAAPDGQKGAVLRREGLYSSHIIEWRRSRDAGALAGLKAPRGRKPPDAQAEHIARLEAEKKRLEQELQGPLRDRCPGKTVRALGDALRSTDTEPKLKR